MRSLIYIFLILSCLSCTNRRVSINGLYIENADWDFGNVDSNASLEHTFILENTSNKVCIIKSIVASCGCTSYSLEKDTLLPNEKSNLNVTLRTPSTVGYFMRDIAVYTSLGERPNILTLNAYIPLSKELANKLYRKKLAEGLFTKTDEVYLGNLFNNKQQSIQIELVNTSEKGIEISYTIEPHYPWIEIVGPNKLEPWRPEVLNVICDGSKTNDDWGEKEFQITIGSGKIKCSISLIPVEKKVSKNGGARVFIPKSKYAISNGRKEVDSIEIRNLGKVDLTILGVRSKRNRKYFILDSAISSMKSGYISFPNIGYETQNDTVEILTNDILNPIVNIMLCPN